MQRFSDQGIILYIKKYSENSLIIKILSKNHGLYSGFIRGAVSSKKLSYKSALYQNFNLVDFEWSSRIADNLGFFKIDLKKSFLGGIISDPIKLSAFGAAASIINQNVLERESAIEIFDGLLHLLEKIETRDEFFLKQYIKFEIQILKILGYGIDFSECAATGTKDNLHFVSPKSARAVCLEAGEKYRDKLLELPQFLVTDDEEITRDIKKDLLSGLKLSGFFINKYLDNSFKAEVFSFRNQLLNLVTNKNNF